MVKFGVRPFLGLFMWFMLIDKCTNCCVYQPVLNCLFLLTITYKVLNEPGSKKLFLSIFGFKPPGCKITIVTK